MSESNPDRIWTTKDLGELYSEDGYQALIDENISTEGLIPFVREDTVGDRQTHD